MNGQWTAFWLEAEYEQFGLHRLLRFHNSTVDEATEQRERAQHLEDVRQVLERDKGILEAELTDLRAFKAANVGLLEVCERQGVALEMAKDRETRLRAELAEATRPVYYVGQETECPGCLQHKADLARLTARWEKATDFMRWLVAEDGTRSALLAAKMRSLESDTEKQND